MTRTIMLFAALLIAAPAFAQDPLAPTASDRGGPETRPPASVQNVQECEGERFVFAWGVGARPTRVTLCSEKGATREEIIAMLQDAANKIDISPLPEDRRTAIALQIRGKVAELQGKGASDAPARTLAPTVSPVAPQPVAPPVRTAPPAVPAPSTQALPPAAPVAPARTAPPAGAVPSTQALPPAAPVAPVAALPQAQLQFRCLNRGESGPGSTCNLLDRHSRLAVTAVEALPVGTSLRFARGGRESAEVALGAMARGQSTILALPPALCSGVVQAQVEVRVVRSGQTVDTAGPFRLRC
jgi:hypothetical protein